MSEQKEINFIDMLSVASFGIGAYALYIGIRNLEENRQQTEDTQNILDNLKKHLKEQDFHLVSQDKILEKLDRKELNND
ncbi:hypothetical protein IKS57_04580 [bacterium]|nr:hypothetical protein [bacterium]